jgi:hypothetical protein
MMARILAFLFLASIVAGRGIVFGPAAAVAGSGPDLSPSEVASAAAAVYLRENRGVIGYQRHLVQQTTAPANNDLFVSDGKFVWRDGVFAKMKFFLVTDNGSALSQADVDKRTGESNDGWTSGKAMFREPFEPGHLSDYTYDISGEAGACSSAATAVRFTSKLRDRWHGDGTMCVDMATKHALLLKFVPAELPPHASTATVTETLGEALPGTWHVVKVAEHYSGQVLFIHGTLDVTADYKDFRRFDTIDAGLASLGSN